ncbi:polysaccharide pyruvyl transferase family protein [Schumannella luteola]
MTRAIFVPGIGQYDNIGDILLRRPLLDRLRRVGPLHVYLGAAPRGYEDGLKLHSSDVVYRSFARWYGALLVHALRGDAHYVFKPGEIQLTFLGLKEHVGMLPALAVVRARGGRILRIGVGARGASRVPAALMRPSIALSHLSVWRDRDTEALLGGETMPDLAFSEAPDTGSAKRGMLGVSLRGDRPEPTDEWMAAVREIATRNGLDLVVVTQVARDRDRSAALAAAWGADEIPWTDDDHAAQEERLRSLYRRAHGVVSDRLHVLIASLTEGAVPIAVVPASNTKIARHFDAAGIGPVTIDANRRPDDIAGEATRLLGDRERLLRERDAARFRVERVLDDVEAVLRGRTS